MSDTPLLKAECEALAKIIARQPHALELKADFDLIFAEARSQVIFEELKTRKIKRLEDCPKLSEM